MGELVVEMILATSHPMEAYGGIVLTRSALEDMARQLRSNNVPMMVGHDPRQPIQATVLEATVRGRDDGFAEVWARVVVDEDQWGASRMSGV